MPEKSLIDAGPSITITTKVWVIRVGGVMHRVGRLRIGDDVVAVVLLCDPLYELTHSTHVREYERSQCPLITCIMCTAKVKD